MKKLKTAIAVTVFVALTAIPSQAVAENIVPPGNSAATQYTEVFPTAGGNAAIKNGSIGGGEKHSPDKTLGHSTTKTLEEHGSEGRAVVELASEGAPAPSPAAEGGESSASGGSANSGSGEKSNGAAAGGGSSGQGGGGSGNGGAHGGAKGGGGQTASIPAATAAGTQVSGASGPSAILAQATGSSSGTMGIFLPLLLVLALAWAVAYSWRQRQLKRAPS
jgi:hypothetical protein